MNITQDFIYKESYEEFLKELAKKECKSATGLVLSFKVFLGKIIRKI